MFQAILTRQILAFTDKLLTAENIYNEGIFYFQNGNLDQALFHFQKVLGIIPDHPYSYYLTGLILKLKGENQKAVENLSKAIKLKGDDPDFYNCLGLVFASEGQIDNAINNFKAAIRLFSKPEYYNNLGLSFHTKEMLKEAIENYNKAVSLDNNNSEYMNNLGVALNESDQNDEACKILGKAILLEPNNPEYYNNLGLNYQNEIKVFLKNKKLKSIGIAEAKKCLITYDENIEKAIENYKKAIDLDPGNPEFYNNWGFILYFQRKYNDAIKFFNKAITLNPNDIKFYNNRAVCFEELGLYKEAIRDYKNALKIEPDNYSALQNIGLLMLFLGDFEYGLEIYEVSRKNMPGKLFVLNKFNKPEWDGSDLRGKVIYVCAEQGYGDELHFLRYITLLAEKGGKIILNCKPTLKSVLETVKGVDLVVTNNVTEETLEFDTFIFLMSLPKMFKTNLENIPNKIPYLSVSNDLKEKWHNKLSSIKGLKIGFVWKSGFPNITFWKRSISIEYFYKLAKEFPEINFISLQKGPFESEINNFLLPNIINFSEEIKDFSDTGGIIENIDLVISVDTAIVHLAGALGKPVWTLLPYVPDWRWFSGGETTPWYSSMKLFRQQSSGDWDSVFEKVTTGLKSFWTPPMGVLNLI